MTFLNEGVLQPDVLAKYAAAIFKNISLFSHPFKLLPEGLYFMLQGIVLLALRFGFLSMRKGYWRKHRVVALPQKQGIPVR